MPIIAIFTMPIIAIFTMPIIAIFTMPIIAITATIVWLSGDPLAHRADRAAVEQGHCIGGHCAGTASVDVPVGASTACAHQSGGGAGGPGAPPVMSGCNWVPCAPCSASPKTASQPPQCNEHSEAADQQLASVSASASQGEGTGQQSAAPSPPALPTSASTTLPARSLSGVMLIPSVDTGATVYTFTPLRRLEQRVSNPPCQPKAMAQRHPGYREWCIAAFIESTADVATSAARRRRSLVSADGRCEWGAPQSLLAVAPWPQLGERSGHHNQLLLKEQLSAAPATNPPILILASPFSRTLETARLVAAEVGVDPFGPHFIVRDELVERDFGSDNEGQPYAGRYEAVWAEDQRDSQHPAGSDGESVVNVAERLRALLQ
ncbi:uncharacterized protein HaLaN_17858, partial [Haematococcus lacustris]